MTNRTLIRIALGIAAAFLAVIAVGLVGPPPESAEAVHGIFPAVNRGWCAAPTVSGDPPLAFTKITTHRSDVDIFTSGDALQKICENEFSGTHMETAEKDRLEGSFTSFSLPPLTSAQDYPKKDWFAQPSECSALPNTIGTENRLQHVYVARTVELALQIVYDVGSNEITGITGAILGVILGVSKAATFVFEWNYDVQDECQEILERRQIADIHTDTDRIITDVKTLLNDIDKHDTAISADTLRIITEVKQLLTGLAGHDSRISADTTRIISDVKELLSDLDTHDAKISADTQRIISDTKQLLSDLDAHDTALQAHDAKIQGLMGTVQTTLDTTVEVKRVHLQVVRLLGTREFLVLADEGGVPIEVEFTNIQFSDDNRVEFVKVTEETDVSVEKTGVYRLVIDPESTVDGIRRAKIWEFQVEHDDGDHSHVGVVVFHENSIGNLGSGQ